MLKYISKTQKDIEKVGFIMAKKKPMTKRRREQAAEKEQSAKKKKIIIISIIVAAILLLTLGIVLIATCDSAADSGEVEYYATIDIANYGSVEIKLDYENAPKTVANFIRLAKAGYYNNKTFDSFNNGMLSAGLDTEGANASIYGEFLKNGHQNNLSHKKGVISMNRGDDYNSAASSFFILTEDKAEFDGLFASFGEVVSGYEIVDKIAGDMIENPDEQAPTILLVSITEKRQ